MVSRRPRAAVPACHAARRFSLVTGPPRARGTRAACDARGRESGAGRVVGAAPACRALSEACRQADADVRRLRETSQAGDTIPYAFPTSVRCAGEHPPPGAPRREQLPARTPYVSRGAANAGAAPRLDSNFTRQCLPAPGRTRTAEWPRRAGASGRSQGTCRGLESVPGQCAPDACRVRSLHSSPRFTAPEISRPRFGASPAVSGHVFNPGSQRLIDLREDSSEYNISRPEVGRH